MLCVLITTLGCERAQRNRIVIIDDDRGARVDDMPYQGKVFIGDSGDRFSTDSFALNTATIDGEILTLNYRRQFKH